MQGKVEKGGMEGGLGGLGWIFREASPTAEEKEDKMNN
jgi:hypothetical protein